MEFVPLHALTKTSGSAPIEVRVCRLWEPVNPNTGLPINLDMVVADVAGTCMWVQIKRTLIKRFRHLLSAGTVYSFTNFTVSPVDGQYRLVNTSKRLFFSLITTVKRVAVPTPGIPEHVFQFVPHATVVQRAGDPTYLTDIVCLLVSVGEVEAVPGDKTKRELEVLSSTEGKVKLTLWGGQAQSFVSAHRLDSVTKPAMLIATSLKVSQYGGFYSFGATSATQVFINLECPDVARVRSELVADAKPFVLLGRSPGTVSTTAEVMSENRMTISEILAAEWQAEKTGYKMTFVGCITEILTPAGWYYLGCPACKSKALPEDGYYSCTNCSEKTSSPMVYYKINFVVEDETDTIICMALNKVAERMVDSSAKKLFNRLDPGVDTFPKQILDLCGQEFIFKIRLTAYNLKDGNDSFTVVDFFTTDPLACKAGSSAAVLKTLPRSPVGPSKGKGRALDSQTEVDLTPRKRNTRHTVYTDDEEE